MTIVAVVVVAALAFVIAALAIGREARRLGAQRFQPVYRLSDAVSWVAADLPDDTASALTAEELEKIERIHLNVLQFDPDAASVADDNELEDPLMVVDADETVPLVYRRVRNEGIDVGFDDVAATVASHMRYLTAIGAIDPVDDD